MTPPKTDLPQGALDLLILKVVALGPVHGSQLLSDWNKYRSGGIKSRKKVRGRPVLGDVS